MVKHSNSIFFRIIVIFSFFISFVGLISPHSVRAQGVITPLQINKQFVDATIFPGVTSKLSITVINPNTFNVQDVVWTDNFPSDIVIAPGGPNTLIVGCGSSPVVTNGSGGTLIAGNTSLKISGATTAGTPDPLVPGTCTVTVDVTASLPGNHINTIEVSAVSANYISDSSIITPITFLADTSATLRVNLLTTPPQINKKFNPATILPGVTSKLSVNVYNPNSFALQDVTWTDTFPSDIVIAPGGPNTLIDGCGPSPVVTNGSGTSLVAGNTSLKISGATTVGTPDPLLPGTCTVTVDVTAFVPGNHVNKVIKTAASAYYVSDPGPPIETTEIKFQYDAQATLLVTPVTAPSLNKGISPNQVYAGETSVLTITITNNDNSTTLTQVALDDSGESP
jgi:hypothetical protein